MARSAGCANYSRGQCVLHVVLLDLRLVLFFFNDTATTEIYTLSLHDALPICPHALPQRRPREAHRAALGRREGPRPPRPDRKSTRLNSSHGYISYAVFCLKKKNERAALGPV